MYGKHLFMENNYFIGEIKCFAKTISRKTLFRKTLGKKFIYLSKKKF